MKRKEIAHARGRSAFGKRRKFPGALSVGLALEEVDSPAQSSLVDTVLQLLVRFNSFRHLVRNLADLWRGVSCTHLSLKRSGREGTSSLANIPAKVGKG